MKSLRVQIALLLAAMLLVTGAWAQKAPATMRLIVPFPPGGPVDFLGRVLADGLRTQLKNIIVVENRPGANGAVAIATLKQAEPDGGTLLVVSSGMITFSPYFEKKLSYDPDRDLVPVVNAAYADVGLVVANKIPATNLREFVALARSSPKPLAMASAGTGNITHAYLELFKSVANIDLLHVPYKGASPALADVLGGQVAGMFIGLSTALPAHKAGRAKVLAVVGKRSSIAPEIPTITEQGFPGVEIQPWFGLMAPTGIPQDAKAMIENAAKHALETDEVKQKLHKAGFTPWVLVGEHFAQMINHESGIWKKLIRDRNLRPE